MEADNGALQVPQEPQQTESQALLHDTQKTQSHEAANDDVRPSLINTILDGTTGG